MERVPNLVREYNVLLGDVQEKLQIRHQDVWVSALQRWRDELTENLSNMALSAHAKRTARTLGGMESIGEIASADRDQRFLELVEALFAKCREIEKACGK